VTTSTTIVPTDVLGESLPRTGASSGPLIGLGLALLLAGAAVTVVAIRRDRA
jgi:LPXTG-motif cell wall-anchored protein